ncbi:GGDEF domain-containing protein [Marinitoga aeolica]|uniref:GGDEF domain-containing protein n=1 Tax=Marinitoga aeolica TaxID=2809031 RepID=A0ABY8PNA6_9BACT|nr:GGDEF domain-containing protein [Marinitoga aeolica]WGS64076.1 GGDEF domain-containing protein [Marinitoga aeolica]
MEIDVQEKLKLYEKHINSTQFDIGFYFLIENISKFIESIDVNIYICENPNFVPENLFKIIRISRIFNFLRIRKIVILKGVKRQRVELMYKEKNLKLNYELLLKSESEIMYYIISKVSPLISLEMVSTLLKGSGLSYIMLNSRTFLEEAAKKETNVDKLIYIYLTAITVNMGGAFNRAILFRKKGDNYEVFRALGFKDEKEAHEVWRYMEEINIDFEEKIKSYKSSKYFSSLEKEIKTFKINKKIISKNPLFEEMLNSGKTIHIPVSVLPVEISDALNIIGECAICSLKTGNKDFGFVVADNRYNLKPISRDQLYILDYFSKQTVILWENKLFIDALKFEAEKDFLTGFYNRRSLEKYIETLTLSAKEDIGIVFIDLDDFKMINDTFGHDKGDEIIQIFSNIVLKNIRREDKPFRYGGDEFVLIFDSINSENLFNIISRINNEFEKETGYTFSSGGTICKDSSEIYQCLKKSDDLLYEIKKSSKGKILIK